MNSEKPKIFRSWFRDFVFGFYNNDPDFNRAIKLKKDHTYRVCENIRYLCESLNLGENDIRMAETTALFHDIGRFPQYARYRTFNDLTSCNHARLGLKIIGRNRVLKTLSTYEKRLISKSIAFHNAVRIPGHLEPKQDLFIRLLRDADKLDIWQVMISRYHNYRENPDNAVFIGLPDRPECSEKILKSIFNGSFARIKDLATLNDFKLLQISWVFDLNFGATYKIVKEKGFINQLADGLPKTPDVKLAVEKALGTVDRFSGMDDRIWDLGYEISDLGFGISE